MSSVVQLSQSLFVFDPPFCLSCFSVPCSFLFRTYVLLIVVVLSSYILHPHTLNTSSIGLNGPLPAVAAVLLRTVSRPVQHLLVPRVRYHGGWSADPGESYYVSDSSGERVNSKEIGKNNVKSCRSGIRFPLQVRLNRAAAALALS